MDIGVSWLDLKSFAIDRSLSIQYVQMPDTYYLFAIDGHAQLRSQISITDPANDDQTDFETNFKANGNKSPKLQVATQFERTDIVLKISKARTSFISGLAEISLKVPGTPGTTDGRYIAGGYAFVDNLTLGDCITAISIVDVDNLLGYGANFVVQTYHDLDVSTENQGWFLWPTQGNCGEIEIDPMGYYGFVPSGLYLEIYFSATTSTNVFCDVWWGKSQ